MNALKNGVFAIAASGLLIGCVAFRPAAMAGSAAFQAQNDPSDPSVKVGNDPGGIRSSLQVRPSPGDELAIFSGVCFWGVEDEFRHVPGVVATAVGFTGGTVANPSYELVCTHTTGHAETVLIEFDPKKVTYSELLAKFWQFHDPTTVDRQGPDEGNNYRSAIWTFSAEQAKEAKDSLTADQKKENAPIVTEILPAQPFYLAEEYHQQYDQKTGRHFCPTGRGN
jgi:peptide-methionine (S)-S-oxide reductase